MDALRQRLGQCWSIPAGADEGDSLKVSVRFRLDRSGNLEGRPEVVRGGANSGAARIAAESAVRAVQKCEPFNLPADKYETWAEVVVNFDPSEMF
jgi:colicin import membrane protein